MGTGAQATFVISWAQTRIGGYPAGPVHALMPGAVWEWTGPVARLDGPQGPLILGAEAAKALRLRAARSVRRMLGAMAPDPVPPELDVADLPEQGFVVTFASAGDRNYYVGEPVISDSRFIDPVHADFKAFVGPLLAPGGVLVFDVAE